MAQGSIRKHERQEGVRYEVVIDLGIDPVSGKRRQRSKSFTTKKEAQTALAAWLTNVDRGVAVDRSRQTVAEMLRYWLESYARPNVRDKTFEEYERIITRHIIPALGNVPIQKLTAAQVQAYYGDKLAAGCGPRTVQLCHLRLSQALDQAVRLGVIPRNVVDMVDPPRVEVLERRVWAEEEVRRFLAVAGQSAYGPIWALFLETGMRRGEVLGVRWQDVDYAARTVAVAQTVGVVRNAVVIGKPKTKSGRRSVAITQAMADALKEHRRTQAERRLLLGPVREDRDLVFPAANGKPIHPSNLDRDFLRWVAQAGVPPIRIHDLRHSNATLWLKHGAPLNVVSQRLGHARTSITLDIYAHVLPDQQAEVADRMGAALFGSAGAAQPAP